MLATVINNPGSTEPERNHEAAHPAPAGISSPFNSVREPIGSKVPVRWRGWATGPEGSSGYRCGPSIGGMFPGALAALGVVAAILNARRTGQGQFLDVAMCDATVFLCEYLIYPYSMAGIVTKPAGNGIKAFCPFDIFTTRDGAIAIACNDVQWPILSGEMERPELIIDRRTSMNASKGQLHIRRTK